MIHPRTALFIALGIVGIVILLRCENTDTIEKNGCNYKRTTTPQGEEILTHINTCGCTGKFEKQFEFKN